MNKKLTPLRTFIILCALVTGLIHLILGPLLLRGEDYQALGLPFILNGIAYLMLLAAYFLPQSFFRNNRRLVRGALILLSAVTILAWLIINRDFTDPLALLSKAAEAVLIVLLLVDRP